MKKSLIVSSIVLLLVGCQKASPVKNEYSTEGYTRQEIASGSYKATQYRGYGTKIGIIEPRFSYKDWDQVKGRLSYGKKLEFDESGAETNDAQVTEPTDPAEREQQKQNARHADMVTAIAMGKDNGIAKDAEGITYQVRAPNLNRYEGKVDITKIYDDAKTKNLVAISNSWGVLPDVSYTGVTGATATNLKNARMSLIYDKYGTGAKDYRNEQLGMVLCPEIKQAIDSGKTLYTNTNIGKEGAASKNEQITSANLQKLYDIDCIGGYDSKVNEATYKAHFGTNFINKIKADKTNDRDAPIWVWAAGNRADKNPVFAGSLPGAVSEAEDYWITVVAVDNSDGKTYKRAWYSGHCGQAKKYCIAAVSDGGKHVNQDGEQQDNRGTSAATPAVAGGMAVIKSAFPSKDNRWVRQRLLASARPMTADFKRLLKTDGTAVTWSPDGLSDEFGNGIMRLDLATKPLGNSELPTAGLNLNNAQKFDVRNSFVRPSAVFGDGLSLGFGQVDTLKFDSMGAEFAHNMGDSVRTVSTIKTESFFDFNKQAYTPQSYAILNSNLSFMDIDAKRFENLEYTQSTMPFVSTGTKPLQIAYRHSDTLSFITRFNPEKTQDKDTITAQLSYKQPSQHSTLNIGVHTEQGTVLGASFNGAYGGIGRANTMYINRQKTSHNNDWDIRYNATASATTTTGIGGGSVQGINGLIASSFSVVAHRTNDKGTLGLAVYQPLRLERGQMDVTFVKGVSDNTKLSYDSKTVNLSPSGRQVSVEAYYAVANSPWTIKANLSQDYGHVKGKNDGTVLLKWFTPFK